MRYFSGNFKSVAKILLVMYGVTALLLFLLAFLVQKLQWKDGIISVGITVVNLLSYFVGAFLMGKVKEQNKIFWMILIGLLYVLSMMAVSFIFSIFL